MDENSQVSGSTTPPIPVEELLRQKIDLLRESKGRIDGQLESMDKNAWNYGAYRWLSVLVTEMLNVYLVLKDHDDNLTRQGERWTKLIGLEEGSKSDEVEGRLTEMGSYFMELDKAWQARKKAGQEALQP